MLSPNRTDGFRDRIAMCRIISHAGVYLVLSFLVLFQGRTFAAQNGTTVTSPREEPRQADSVGDAKTSQPAGSSVPRLSLDTITYDFGKLRPNSKNTATFGLTNTGSGVLRIRDIKKCCGAVVKLDKKELCPGESEALTAEYTAPQREGLTTKKIGLATNDPEMPQVELTIEGTVIQTLTWVPRRFDLSPFREDTKCPDITIKSLDGTPFSIKGFAAAGQALAASFDPNLKATEFTLQPMVDMAKLKALTTPTCSLVVNVDHPDYKAINVPFEVIQPLQATPPQVLVFNAKAGEPVAKVVQLQDNQADPNTGAPVAIESVTARNGSRVEVRGVTANKTGCELKLEIWPAAGKESESFSTDQLVVKLKDGRELAVPVRVFYQSPAVSSAASRDLRK